MAYKKENFPFSSWKQIISHSIKNTENIAVVITKLNDVDLWVAVPFSEIPNNLKNNSKHHVINFYHTTKKLEDSIIVPMNDGMNFLDMVMWCLNNPKGSISFDNYLITSYIYSENLVSIWDKILDQSINHTDDVAVIMFVKNFDGKWNPISKEFVVYNFLNDIKHEVAIHI